MPRSNCRQPGFPRLLGALLLMLLSACSAVQTGYNNAPTLFYWWLDSYIDFNDAQAPLVRDSLATLHTWHRQHELPAYAELLRQLRELAPADVTPQQVCTLTSQIQQHAQRLGEQTAEGLSRLAPTLQPAQLQHLAQQFDKHNRKWREQWLDGSPAERAARRLDKAVERAEGFYGTLNAAQRDLLRQRIADSGFDPESAWAERLHRQQDLLKTFTQYSGSEQPAQIQTDMLALIRRNLNSSDTAYRAQFERMLQESCETIAALHNSASAAQRRQLQDKLRAYETDVRALASTVN